MSTLWLLQEYKHFMYTITKKKLSQKVWLNVYESIYIAAKIKGVGFLVH